MIAEIALAVSLLVGITILAAQYHLFRRQDALGRALRTLADAISQLPHAAPVTLLADVPGADDPPEARIDEPLTRVPSTVERWETGRRRVE